MPALTRVAILSQPGTLRDETFRQMVKDAEETARYLGLKLQFVEARSGNDLDVAFDQMGKESPFIHCRQSVLFRDVGKQLCLSVERWA